MAEIPPEGSDSPIYLFMLKLTILLVFLSLVALGVQTFRQPDADNSPAPFSCSIVPPDSTR